MKKIILNNISNTSFGWRNVGFILLIIPFILALSTVFVIDKSLAHGIISGKYFWFYGSMGLVATSAFVYSIINKQPFRFSLTDCFVLLFTGSVFLSAYLFSDVLAGTKLTLLALLLVLYFCLRLVLSSESYKIAFSFLNLLCLFIIITGLVEAVWGLQQLYGFKPSQHHLFKITGSFFNPGPYAGYLAVVFPLALYYSIRGTVEKSHYFATISLKIIGAITCVAIIIVLPAAMSRASWLAAIAGSLLVFTARYWKELITMSEKLSVKNKKARRKLLFILGSSLITLILFLAIAGMYNIKKNSADGRLLTWKVSLTALANNPLGVGLGHFPDAYGDAQAAYFASGNASETEEYVAGNPEYGFNEFLQIGIESGIMSLLLFIGMLVCAFRSLARTKNWGVMGSLLALLVFACFSYPFSVLPFAIVFVFLIAMSETKETRINTDLKSLSAPIRVIRVICVPVLCLLLTAFCLYKQYPVHTAYKQWNSNRMYYQVGMYKEAAQAYEPLYPYLSDQIQFLREYGRSLSQSEQPEKSNAVFQQAAKISCNPTLYNTIGRNYQAMKKYDRAEESFLKSSHIVPNRLSPHYLLMKLYVETGEEEKARKAANIVLTKEPKVQSKEAWEMKEEARKIKN